MKKHSSIIIFLLLVAVVVAYVVLNDPSYQEEKIALGEYKTYDAYGVSYIESESEVYPFLVENLDLSTFVSTDVVSDEKELFKSTDITTLTWVSGYIKKTDLITEIYMSIDINTKEVVTISIDYLDNEGKRVIVTYTAEGKIDKAMKIEDDKVVNVTNGLIKITQKIK